jgi:PAS domain S-box-containing protein
MLMEIRYSPSLVLLSIAVAVFASFVALNLAHSVSQAKGRAQLVWLAGGALAMGIGIWSMHFVGMLAFEMPSMEMAYDVPLMLLSVLVAVFASALALYIVSRPAVTHMSLLLGGVAMAAAISGMHYIGMYSMRMSARIQWNPYLIVLSVLIALAASFAALMIAIRLRNKPDRFSLLLLSSILMGIGISGMHYTGMMAATFIHDESVTITDSNLLVTSGLSVAVVTTTLLILGIALMSSIGERMMTLRSKRAEDVLVSSEERFRLLVEAVKDYAIFMLDPDGYITTWNSGAERITGYADEEVIGKHFLMLHYQDDISKCAAELRTAREEGHYEGEAIHVKKDGSLFWANTVINPLYNAEGVLTGFSKVTRDITQLKAAEEKMRNINVELENRVRERTAELEARESELKSAKEAAEVANATKSAFLANMSHEIRTPLGAVLGFSELLLDDDMSPAEKRHGIEIIKRNGKLLSNIINDILDLSKVEAGKLDIEKADVRLIDLLNDTVALLKLEAKEKGIDINVSSEGAIPNFVKTDPTRLRQILFNIIGNAVKFTKKGSVDVVVKLLPFNGVTKLAFVIKDSGVGVTAEQSKRLFSAFTQADVTTTRKFGGTGLGLVLSKKLANALGGDVILESSELDKGSTFIVFIDQAVSGNATFDGSDWNSKSIAVPSTPTGSPRLSDLKILLVDDSLDNQALVKKMLMLAGATVEIANNGREAIQKTLNGNFNLILMDLQMPEMDGYEATRELRRCGFNRPIIALTAHAMKEERKRCLDSGFDDQLTKPVERDVLIATLAEYSTSVRPVAWNSSAGSFTDTKR